LLDKGQVDYYEKKVLKVMVNNSTNISKINHMT
jgi:hypothetical protein